MATSLVAIFNFSLMIASRSIPSLSSSKSYFFFFYHNSKFYKSLDKIFILLALFQQP